jgi:hypothetical protein
VRSAAFLFVLTVACGGAQRDATSDAAVADAVAPSPGDLLLARARLSIEHGVLAPELEDRILASSAPEHARARRLLQAMHDGIAPAPPDDDPLAAPTVASTTLSPALAAPPEGELPPIPEPAAAPAGAPAPAAAPAPAPAPRSTPAFATLERVAIQSTSEGATLSITASAGVLVGVASQPEAGILRLVLDDVRAAPKVLSSRPGIRGARVRSIDAGEGGVRITLALDPGWRFRRVRRTATGAKVELTAPS